LREKILRILQPKLGRFVTDPSDTLVADALAGVITDEMRSIDEYIDAFVDDETTMDEAIAAGVMLHCALQAVQQTMMLSLNRTMNGTSLDPLFTTIREQHNKKVHMADLGGRAN
jgi:hypothetical protein